MICVPRNRIRSSTFLLCAVLGFIVFGIVGCDDTRPKPAADTGKKGDVIYAFKDGQPFLVMDLYPELGRILELSQTAREEYLLARAVEAAQGPSMSQAKYQGKTHCLLRMLLVRTSDEYDAAQWGVAPEIALLELDRTKCDALAAGQHSAAEIRGCFDSVQIHHERIKR